MNSIQISHFLDQFSSGTKVPSLNIFKVTAYVDKFITAGMSKLVYPKLALTPGEHKNICMTLYNVGPTSKTLGRRCINVIQMCCVCWAGELPLKHSTFVQCWFNVGPALQTLVQH